MCGSAIKALIFNYKLTFYIYKNLSSNNISYSGRDHRYMGYDKLNYRFKILSERIKISTKLSVVGVSLLF